MEMETFLKMEIENTFLWQLRGRQSPLGNIVNNNALVTLRPGQLANLGHLARGGTIVNSDALVILKGGVAGHPTSAGARTL